MEILDLPLLLSAQQICNLLGVSTSLQINVPFIFEVEVVYVVSDALKTIQKKN